MTFNNSILSGTTLAREDIRSEGFAAGVSGWIVERDGDAEFNSIVVRGSVTSVGAIYTANIFDGRINIFLNSDPDQVTEWSPGALIFNPIDGSSGLMLDYDEPDAIGFRVTGGDPQGVFFDRASKFFYKTKSAGTYTKEDWTQATLAANWVHLGEPVKYKLFPDGTVRLRGGAHYNPGVPADGTVVFNLPAGYRPVHNSLYPIPFWGSNVVGRTFIGSGAGDVQTFGAPTQEIAFDSVAFGTV